MKKNCKKCGGGFEIELVDIDYYQKIDVPTPTLCPSCRMQRKIAFRNERNLYKAKCDFSNKQIVSLYPPTTPYKIYSQEVWWSDKWDPMEYGREFDFGRPFFEQYLEMFNEIPKISLQNRSNENSGYANDSTNLKDCYLCFNAEAAEDCYYCTTFGMSSRDCVDMFWSLQCELCYECTKVTGAYHCFWCFNCQNISDCFFCEDLIGCKNCFGCIGLRQKEYCLFNEQMTKEVYEKFIQDFKFSYKGIEFAQNKLAELRLKVPHKHLNNTNVENCLGDYLTNCKNCVHCFDVSNSENCKYVWDGIADNSYDCFNTGIDSNFVYESLAVYRSTNVKFSHKCTTSSDIEYCNFLFFCDSCFGCNSLRHKKYCILNKQYTKEEYHDLLPRIIDHMKVTGEYGEFFPVELAPCGYNESMAMEYYPLSREQALEQGYKWNDYESPKVDGINSITAADLPEKIEDVSDSFLKSVIECENDQKLFKVIPKELEFYRKHGLPLPRQCPDCRHFARKGQMNPRKLWNRRCHKSNVEVLSTYSPERPEKVYCEECYLSSRT